MTNKKILESYDFRLVTRAAFDKAEDVPHGLRERVALLPGAFVVYDPLDDDEGFLLVSDDVNAIAAETVREHDMVAGE